MMITFCSFVSCSAVRSPLIALIIDPMIFSFASISIYPFFPRYIKSRWFYQQNDSLDDISRSGDNWINTETTAAHAYAVGLEYADPSERNKDNPIPVLKYDHENDFPLMRIEGVSSSIRPYSMELIRGSSGWSLRIHSFIDGGVHALDVPLNLIS